MECSKRESRGESGNRKMSRFQNLLERNKNVFNHKIVLSTKIMTI